MRTQTELDAANRFESYRKGWQAGACTRAMDPLFTQRPPHDVLRVEYEVGYLDGGIARRKDLDAAADRYGHVVNILRLESEG